MDHWQLATAFRRSAAWPSLFPPHAARCAKHSAPSPPVGWSPAASGSGTFVIYEPEAADTDVSEITSPLELVEVRRAIEPQMARLAVRNATARDISALGRALVEMEATNDPERFSAADEAFHLHLAEATHNPLIIEIYRRINHVRAHEQWNSIKDKILTPPQIAAYNAEHRELLAAVSHRDAERAVAIIEAHLGRANADLMASAG